MRTLLVLTAALGLAGVADAQNTATSSQTGTDHLATINQTGSNDATLTQTGTSNEGEIDQIGLANTATLTQSGSGNFGDIDQPRGGSATSTLALVTQTGTDGTVWVWQGRDANGVAENSSADVEQGGADNVVYVTQGASGSDDGSSTVIRQGAGTSNGTAYSFQGHGFSNRAARNTGTITQISGDSNAGQVAQGAEVWSGRDLIAEDNTITITQTGNRNSAASYQGTSVEWEVRHFGGSAYFNTATSTQEGDDNKARVFQGIDDGSASNSTATTTQIGGQNDVRVTQHGVTNIADVRQEGLLNVAEVEQGGDGNHAVLEVQGDANGTADDPMTIVQAGSFHDAQARFFDGSGNALTIDQLGGDSNEFFLDAVGDAAGDGSDGNSLDVDQNGSSNRLSGYLSGDDNTITLEQLGSSNAMGSAVLTAADGFRVVGYDNALTVRQLSDGNTATALIDGSANSTVITQN